ncbi:MAG TPA: ABC transporter permease [Thermoanaerobaculia bacterium]|nr:ABC transporter permease [Thermoanaerobaculia bacterium]
METLLQDLRLSCRLLAKSPGLTAVAVLCIALGIGANTTVYSIVEAVLLRPFPFADPDRIVALHRSRTLEPSADSFSYPDFFDLQRQTKTLAAVGAFRGVNLTFGGKGAEPERVAGQAVSAALFPLLAVRPVLGRGFLPQEDRPGAAAVILLGNELWQRRYHGDPAILGRTVTVDGAARTIVGVMPPRFGFPALAQAWVPLAPVCAARQRGERELDVLARLRPGLSAAQARAELTAFASRLVRQYPDVETGWEATLRPLREELVDATARLFLVTLLGSVLFVLLVACANVANLQLVRAADRQREVAVRLAFGAGRGRIVRQLLTESLLLAAAGAALGVLFAAWGIHLFATMMAAEHPLPYWVRFDLDAPVLLCTLLAAAGTGLLFGLAPAASAARSDLQQALKEGGRAAGAGRGRRRLRGALVVVEVALVLTLLVGAALFTRAFLALRQESGGFDTGKLLTLHVYLPGKAYESDAAKTRRVDDVVRRIEALPGVEQAAASCLVPLSYGTGSHATVAVPEQAVPRGAEPSAFYTGVTGHFFSTLGVPLLYGRGFTASEAATLTPFAVVNAAFADHFWRGEPPPIGRRFKLSDTPHPEWLTVIGVVADFKNDEIHNRVEPSAYLPYPYLARSNTGLIVRGRVRPAALAPLVRKAVQAADPGLPVFQVATMEQVRRAGYWAQRLFSQLFAVFGGIALCLAAIGIYGVLSYNVSQRRREIGVRLALGARQHHVLGLVIGQAMALTAAGIACGIAAALSLNRVLAQLLYEVSPTDPASFAVIALFLAGVALLASAVPARRALDADPLEALRQE